MRTSYRVLFQKEDVKLQNWSKHMKARGVRADGLKGSPVMAPVKILRKCIAFKRYDGYCFRYLNDHPSLARSLFRVFAEVVTIILCKITRTDMWWILHNVDRESECNWPLLSRFRRYVVSRVVKAGFVTDPMLIPYAAERFPHVAWHAMSFGVGDSRTCFDDGSRIRAEAKRLRASVRSEGISAPRVALCATSFLSKYVHLRRFEFMLNKYPSMALVFVGNMSSLNPQWADTIERIRRHSRTTIVDCGKPIDEGSLAGCVDAIYRATGDQSVPLSLYRAARAGIPIITHEGEFSATVVRAYGVGLVVESCDNNCLDDFLDGWSSEIWNSFVETRSWARGADEFCDVVLGG